MPPPCLWIGAGETTASARSPRDCWTKPMATVPPRARKPSQMRGPSTKPAGCFQKQGSRRDRSSQPFAVTPWRIGARPVRKVAEAVQVTAGKVEPTARSGKSARTSRPWAAAKSWPRAAVWTTSNLVMLPLQMHPTREFNGMGLSGLNVGRLDGRRPGLERRETGEKGLLGGSLLLALGFRLLTLADEFLLAQLELRAKLLNLAGSGRGIDGLGTETAIFEFDAMSALVGFTQFAVSLHGAGLVQLAELVEFLTKADGLRILGTVTDGAAGHVGDIGTDPAQQFLAAGQKAVGAFRPGGAGSLGLALLGFEGLGEVVGLGLHELEDGAGARGSRGGVRRHALELVAKRGDFLLVFGLAFVGGGQQFGELGLGVDGLLGGGFGARVRGLQRLLRLGTLLLGTFGLAGGLGFGGLDRGSLFGGGFFERGGMRGLELLDFGTVGGLGLGEGLLLLRGGRGDKGLQFGVCLLKPGDAVAQLLEFGGIDEIGGRRGLFGGRRGLFGGRRGGGRFGFHGGGFGFRFCGRLRFGGCRFGGGFLR